MESTSGMVKPRVDPDPGSRLSTPGKLLLRLMTTPVFRLPTSGKLLLRLMTVKIFRLLQSAGTCRDFGKPLAKAHLRNERHVEEVLYFRT